MKRELIKVGFWKDTKALFDLLGYPDPRDLVDHEWMKEKRETISKYLDAGKHVETYLGFSYCRFGCAGVDMGTADLSDGRYLWPEGLSHYVRVHHVRLPKKFATHVLNNLHRIKDVPVQSENEKLLAAAGRELGEWLNVQRQRRSSK